jgi:hypothetical protein
MSVAFFLCLCNRGWAHHRCCRCSGKDKDVDEPNGVVIVLCRMCSTQGELYMFKDLRDLVSASPLPRAKQEPSVL